MPHLPVLPPVTLNPHRPCHRNHADLGYDVASVRLRGPIQPRIAYRPGEGGATIGSGRLTPPKGMFMQVSVMKVSVDRARCIGTGCCVANAPSVFQLDEEKLSTVIDPDGQ